VGHTTAAECDTFILLFPNAFRRQQYGAIGSGTGRIQKIGENEVGAAIDILLISNELYVRGRSLTSLSENFQRFRLDL
jgi:hypothetical protein